MLLEPPYELERDSAFLKEALDDFRWMEPAATEEGAALAFAGLAWGSRGGRLLSDTLPEDEPLPTLPWRAAIFDELICGVITALFF